MKGTKIAYWVFTILMILLMLSSVIGTFVHNPKGEEMMGHIGYPMSLLVLLSVGKVLGIIAILVPGFPRLKEWAYAGFAFDLIGAFHAGMAVHDPVGQWAIVLLGLIFVFGSYFLYHKINRNKKAIV
jgi:uncharacterized membrane protein YphA (DoxX/SURF4 family)